ncbi:MAG TPA: protein translocase subunit SecF [Ktedonobacteraceae bacterium]|nr:protein translocase subunit SecF [Ktedonobacteraceae bacterium]
MFNLVKRRYLFLLISLVVIVPGTISLIIFHLDVGIDFAGGATVELRPNIPISTTNVGIALKPLNLQNLAILTGNNTALKADQFIWVRLNTQVDSNVQQAIITDLQNKYGKALSVDPENLAYGGKTMTVITITNFPASVVPTTADIQQILKNLPKTTSPSKNGSTGASATPTVGPVVSTSPTPTATATPKATATATGKSAAGTPTASPTPTTTPTTNPLATIPVSIADIQQGQTTNTISLQTSTTLTPNNIIAIRSAFLNSQDTYTYITQNSTVTASVAADTTNKAFLAVLAASFFILLYIWLAFRKVARPWRYGVCAIIALLHDVLVVLGVFSILGWLFHVQVNTLFITALLTICGFSVHDTIVVFDRIRENSQRRTSESFEQIVNASLVQTMARSLNTSLTVLFTLSALTLFGGDSIRTFTGALLVGIFSGTYSSIFNASMLLVIWDKGELGLNRLNRNRDRTPDGRDVRELARSRG